MVMEATNLTVFGDPVDLGAVEQIKNCLKHPAAREGALMADHHVGYAMPIGGVVAYDDAVSPTGVGFDIACGNKCVRTNLRMSDLGSTEALNGIMREIRRRVAFGLGRSSSVPADDSILDDCSTWQELDTHFGPELRQKAAAQLGTVGAGNHYVDLLVDAEGDLWIANHFGSRGLGHTIASGFMAAAAGRDFTDRVPATEAQVVLTTATPFLMDFYIAAMQLAGRYAYAGRDYVIEQVLGILGARATFSVHNHHNFAWHEDDKWIVRKGATPLGSEPAFIGGSMGDASVIVRGREVHEGADTLVGTKQVRRVVDIGNLGSAPHGAGRVMSRTKAAGKMRKMWYCNNRNCTFTPERSTGVNTGYPRNCCPLCGLPLRKGRMRDTSEASIDWDATLADLRSRGIVVLGARADEAPGVYKNLAGVLAAHSNVEILHTLQPIGVVMAGPDERDPYKD
jgi:tRNA-splicing ligase RtcB